MYFSYKDDQLQPTAATVVSEFPLQLIVNGREIATLIGSPHELRFLVAGFLRLQGFVSSLQDFEMFSVCEEFGTANVRIKGELPERLKPVLTSGCGTGITFTLPTAATVQSAPQQNARKLTPGQIFALMHGLTQTAEHYRLHGGIHSAAIGKNGKLMLYAEDLGRHNTFDRIAGEALFRGMDITGTELVTSGRVSTEMVAKAALMGIRSIASRTSPTDMAIKLCEQAGICLIGYVRGGTFTVYCHPEAMEDFSTRTKIEGISGYILAGGCSKRMGRNKALLEVDGIPIITRTYQTLARLFHKVTIVTNTPEAYDFLPCQKVADIYPDCGSIAGLHAALCHSDSAHTFVTACDLPFLDPAVISYLCELRNGDYDAVVPYCNEGLEPLHAVYDTAACKNVVAGAIENGERKIVEVLGRMKLRQVSDDEILGAGGQTTSFCNVNTPQEFERIRTVRRK